MEDDPSMPISKANKDQDREKAMEEINIRMKEIDDYEGFLGSMTLALSNYIILVLHETSLSEQKFLFDVVRRWYDYRDDSKSPFVFVVHNFKTTTDGKERDELFLVRTRIPLVSQSQ